MIANSGVDIKTMIQEIFECQMIVIEISNPHSKMSFEEIRHL